MGKILYLGTDVNFFVEGREVLHYPVIRIVPKHIEIGDLSQFSHYIITSKNAVEMLFFLDEGIGRYLQGRCLSIGPATTNALRRRAIEPFIEVKNCSQEGIIEEMKCRTWEGCSVFYPRSSLARPLLLEYLQKEKINHKVLDLYDTVYQMPYKIDSFDDIDEIIFTSSSTVEGFFRIYMSFPSGVKWKFQGPITEATFWEKMKRCNY